MSIKSSSAQVRINTTCSY